MQTFAASICSPAHQILFSLTGTEENLESSLKTKSEIELIELKLDFVYI